MKNTPFCLPEDLPAAYLERMRSELCQVSPDSYDAFLSAYRDPPIHALRLNTLRGAGSHLLPFPLASAVSWEPDGRYYEESPELRPGKHILHEAGAYYIQEASAMLPARMMPLDTSADSRPLRVLDLCAAPGGKSVQLAMRMQGKGLLVCNEIHPDRARILSQNIERMGIANAVVTNEPPERLADRFPLFFDRILTDAPCSGEGMFRKNPEAVAEWSEDAVEKCAARQREILARAAEMLAPGGCLVYSTCTFAPAEDEEMITWFLRAYPEMRLIRQEKLMPHQIRGEGHFSALLSYDAPPVPSYTGQMFCARHSARFSPRDFSKWLRTLLTDPSRIGYAEDRLVLFGDHIYLIPAGFPDSAGLKVLRPGLHLADLAVRHGSTEYLPAHALSHALFPADAQFSQALSEGDAEAYLRGQALRLEAADAPAGKAFVLMTYGGFSLGWARYAGGQFKNLYPKGLRQQNLISYPAPASSPDYPGQS